MTRIYRTFFISAVFILAGLPLRFAFAGEGEASSSTPEAASGAPTRTVSVTVRDGGTLIWSGSVSVPDSDTATTTVTATDGTESGALAASALAALVAADATSTTFSISNLQYFSSFDSFYVKCLAYTLERCDNWQYVVGTTYPGVGMDQFLLHNGDTLFVYFGSPRRTTLSTSTVHVNESFTATAENYLPFSDSYAPAVGVTIGITQTNPSDPYTPLVVATSTTDAAGTATFRVSRAGAYAVGIAEDYYYPSVSLSVVEASVEASTTPQAANTLSRGSVGGGAGNVREHTDIPAAVSFLTAHQRADGSFETSLLSDWAALAFSATPEEETGEALLREYLTRELFSASSVTDYERHAMALMALKVDPYTGTTSNYIDKILSYFDGAQFGDPFLVNDDIFAFFPLLRAGYGASDEPLANALKFILSKKRNDGSWEGNVDLTAAAVQALTPLAAESGVSSALSRARGYLRSAQQADGGFGNSFSTSWALQAISAMGDDPSSWQSSGGRNPREYLAALQSPDGGFEDVSSDERSRLWATEYAIPAALARPWFSLLASFAKPAGTSPASGAAASASVLIESGSTVFATRAPLALGIEASTTAQNVVSPVATSTDSASTTEPVIASSLVPEAPTTSPQHAASSVAVLGSGVSREDKAEKKAVVVVRENTPATTASRVGVFPPLRAASAERNSASAVAAVETAGVSSFFLRLVGWVEDVLSALWVLLI